VAKALSAARARIVRRCGATFDQLGLASSATLDERLDALLDQTTTRARHLAQRVYPPLNLGSTGLFGPYPVGVRTFHLVDPSRLNVTAPVPGRSRSKSTTPPRPRPWRAWEMNIVGSEGGDDVVACFSNCGLYKFPTEPALTCNPDPATDPRCYYWKTFCAGCRRRYLLLRHALWLDLAQRSSNLLYRAHVIRIIIQPGGARLPITPSGPPPLCSELPASYGYAKALMDCSGVPNKVFSSAVPPPALWPCNVTGASIPPGVLCRW